jgi:sugar phosphate isomerase/epimerase
LDRRGYKVGIISNINSSVEAQQFLNENHLEGCVSTVVLSIVFGRKKPHPAIFYAAAREIQVPVQNCAYVGNNIHKDVIGSREAGIGKVVVLMTEKGKKEISDSPLQPDHLIDGLRDLLDIFPPMEKQLVADPQDESPVLYDVALSTMWHVRQSIPFQETFQVARSLGFARFELNHQIPPERFDQIDFSQYRIGSLHDPCPAVVSMDEQKQKDWMVSSLDEECRLQGVNIVKRTIDEAVKLHARLVVIHPGSIVADSRLDRELRKRFKAGEVNENSFNDLRDELIADRKMYASAHLESVLRSMKEIIEYARPAGISIGLENRYRYYDIPILEELEPLLNLCSEEWYGFQYDIGHAQTLDRLGLCNHEEWLLRYANRMVGVHIHDVKGIVDHQKPGTGDVDFEMVARYLSHQVYRTLEVSPDLSTEDIAAALETLVRVGCIHRL